eukprot:6503759-Alexandrium_andersonii.AAC.1
MRLSRLADAFSCRSDPQPSSTACALHEHPHALHPPSPAATPVTAGSSPWWRGSRCLMAALCRRFQAMLGGHGKA